MNNKPQVRENLLTKSTETNSKVHQNIFELCADLCKYTSEISVDVGECLRVFVHMYIPVHFSLNMLKIPQNLIQNSENLQMIMATSSWGVENNFCYNF